MDDDDALMAGEETNASSSSIDLWSVASSAEAGILDLLFDVVVVVGVVVEVAATVVLFFLLLGEMGSFSSGTVSPSVGSLERALDTFLRCF